MFSCSAHDSYDDRCLQCVLGQNKILESQNQNLESQNQNLESQNQNLRKQLTHQQQSYPGDYGSDLDLIIGVSSLSKDEAGRKNYYDNTLKAGDVPGAFAGHAFMVDFVKKSRVDTDWINPTASGLADALKSGNRDSLNSMLRDNYLDLEEPQSYVASLLLSMAVSDVEKAQLLPLFVGHQGTIKCKTPLAKVAYTMKLQQKNLQRTVPIMDPVVDFKVDILVSILHKFGSKLALVPFASIEYKPGDSEEAARIAQRDMYGTNMCGLFSRPAISIDIAGGNDVEKWKITAVGYLVKPKTDAHPQMYERSVLYAGNGLQGLYAVANGLVAAKQNFFDFAGEKRMGPTVALRDGSTRKVVKAYDSPRYRKPNADVLKKLYGNGEVTEWTSGGCTIIEMPFFESNWRDPKGCEVSTFSTIIRDLRALHSIFGAHGDIRLANLRSCGKIIDFDFVGKKTYPPGLSAIADGERHADVSRHISTGNIGTLNIEKKHDWYSFGAIMNLFTPGDKSLDEWGTKILILQNDPNEEAINALLEWLDGHGDKRVHLKPDCEPILYGTGSPPLPKK